MNILTHYFKQKMKKQKITTTEALQAYAGLELFGNADRPGTVAMNTMLILSALEPIHRAFTKLRDGMFDTWGLKDDKGQFVPATRDGKPVPDTKQIAPEHLDEYRVKIAELEAIIVEVETPELAVEDLNKITVSPNLLRMFKPFISFAPASVAATK